MSRSSEIPKSAWIPYEDRRRSVGLGYDLGLTFGSAYNFTKGFISSSSSSSIGSRLINGLRSARAKCIPTCGTVAGLFLVGEVVGNVLVYYRRKDDPFNTFACCVTSATVVGAVSGVKRSPLFCACVVLGYGAFGAATHHYGLKYIQLKDDEELRKRDN